MHVCGGNMSVNVYVGNMSTFACGVWGICLCVHVGKDLYMYTCVGWGR